MKEKFVEEYYKLTKNQDIFAHIHEEKESEKLTEHLLLTMNYAVNIDKKYGVINKTYNLLKNICIGMNLGVMITLEDYREEVFRMIFSHDYGKINANFQMYKMHETNETYREESTYHSHLSSALYFYNCYERYVNSPNKYLSSFLYYVLSYIISKHHSGLNRNFIDEIGNVGESSFFKSIITILNREDVLLFSKVDKDKCIKVVSLFQKNFKNLYKLDKDRTLYESLYVIIKLLNSLLIASDTLSTMDYMQDIHYILKDNNAKDMIKNYKNSKIYKGIIEYKEKKEQSEAYGSINELRCELFLEAEDTLNKHLDENIFYLDAATGMGKSNISLNLALNILNKNSSTNKVIYVSSLNSVSSQTYDYILSVLGSEFKDRISLINSDSDIYVEKTENISVSNKDLDYIYTKSYTDYQLQQYDFSCISHVKLFQILFGTSRTSQLSLTTLINSVIIVDEIQTWSYTLWLETIKMMKAYADALNIKFFIMSATLPRLGTLIKQDFTSLINMQKYNENDRYKKYLSENIFEYKMDYLGEGNCSSGNEADELRFANYLIKNIDESLKSKDKILVEFIKKKDARKFYHLIKNFFDNIDVRLMTGDTSIKRRKLIIEDSKKEGKMILISTQVIEAGIDIDFDEGFMNFSYLENMAQFAGRINRNGKKKNCIIHYFQYTKPETIYVNDIERINESRMYLNNNPIQSFKKKEFESYFRKNLKVLNDENNNTNKKEVVDITYDLKNLNFNTIKNKMKLLKEDENMYRIVLLDSDEYSTFLENIKNIHTIENYARHKIELHNYLNKYKDKENKLYFYKENGKTFDSFIIEKYDKYFVNIGDIYYIEDDNKQDYYVDGLFDTDSFLYSKKEESIFI